MPDDKIRNEELEDVAGGFFNDREITDAKGASDRHLEEPPEINEVDLRGVAAGRDTHPIKPFEKSDRGPGAGVVGDDALDDVAGGGGDQRPPLPPVLVGDDARKASGIADDKLDDVAGGGDAHETVPPVPIEDKRRDASDD